jgi:hypothetical protein
MAETRGGLDFAEGAARNDAENCGVGERRCRRATRRSKEARKLDVLEASIERMKLVVRGGWCTKRNVMMEVKVEEEE